MEIIGNIAYFSGGNKLYFMTLTGASGQSPSLTDITPTTVNQSYVLVPFPDLNEIFAIGGED